MTAIAGKANAFELSMIKLIFNAVTITGIAQDIAGGGNANLYVSLHTADPTEEGSAVSSETAYTNYARVAVARTTGGWTAANPTGNVAAITFPTCGASGATITHFGIVDTASGAGVLLYAGQLTSQLIVSNGITPSFAIGALTVAEG